MKFEVGKIYKLKPKQQTKHDIVSDLKEIAHNFHAQTHTHKVIQSAISELEELEKCCGEMHEIIDRLETRIERLTKQTEGSA